MRAGEGEGEGEGEVAIVGRLMWNGYLVKSVYSLYIVIFTPI